MLQEKYDGHDDLPGTRVDSSGTRVDSSGTRVDSPITHVDSPGTRVDSPGTHDDRNRAKRLQQYEFRGTDDESQEKDKEIKRLKEKLKVIIKIENTHVAVFNAFRMQCYDILSI